MSEITNRLEVRIVDVVCHWHGRDCTGVVERRVDPYRAEVHDEEIEIGVCGEGYDLLCDEI